MRWHSTTSGRLARELGDLGELARRGRMRITTLSA